MVESTMVETPVETEHAVAFPEGENVEGEFACVHTGNESFGSFRLVGAESNFCGENKIIMADVRRVHLPISR